VGLLAALRKILGQLAVVIPIAMKELYGTDAALGQPPRQQAIGGEGSRLAGVLSVKLKGAGRLLRKVRQLGHRRLHAERHLVLRDARRDLRIAKFIEPYAVQL